MYIYGCFMLKFDREQQKSVKQLSFNLKINLNKKPPLLPKKKQRHYFANKGPYSQSYGFSSSHVT